MKTASIRDLRKRFPEVRRLLEREREVVVTDQGKPDVLSRNYEARPEADVLHLAHFQRLCSRMPKRLSAAERRALDAEDRGERCPPSCRSRCVQKPLCARLNERTTRGEAAPDRALATKKC